MLYDCILRPQSLIGVNCSFYTGFYDGSAVREMLKECAKMYTFSHPNVLTLSGVCLDGGPAPYIIMPFMANGCLLSYLKKQRAKLVISSNDSDAEEVHYSQRLSVLIAH